MADHVDGPPAYPRRAHLTFDDIPTAGGTADVPPAYGGLSYTWGWHVSNPAQEFAGTSHAHNGYFTGLTSGDQLLYANGGNVAFAAYNGQGTFTLKSLNLTAAFDKRMVMDVYGYHNDVVVYHSTLTLTDLHHTHFAPNWTGVDYVLFRTGAEVHDPKSQGSSSYWVLDDLIVGAIDRSAAAPTVPDHTLSAGAFASHHSDVDFGGLPHVHGPLAAAEHLVLA